MLSRQQKIAQNLQELKNYTSDAMKLLADTLNCKTSSKQIEFDLLKKQKTSTNKSASYTRMELPISYQEFQMTLKKKTYINDTHLYHEKNESSILYEKEDLDKISGKCSEKNRDGCDNFGKGTALNDLSIRISDLSDQSADEECQNKRNLVYEHQSYKQQKNNQDQTTIDANNKLFQLIFLKKCSLSQTVSTTTSSTRTKENKRKQGISISQFSVGKKLGAGKFGQVYAAIHKKIGFLCALKKIRKNDVDARTLIQLIREIKIQGFLDHPNIAKLYNFFSDEDKYCASGDMYSFLKKKKRVEEYVVQNLMRQVCKAIEYMHECTIIHRDLKPENILLNNGMVKICDFGWSISSTVNRETFCGTPLYVSPQLLKRDNYNNKIDVWSIGILTYQLLIGRVPFDIFTEGDLIKIVEDDIYFSKKYQISKEAKSFILNCLQKDPRDRLSVTELLEHNFVNNIESSADMKH